MFKIDDASLHSAVQEDNHIVLSISYIAQHFAVVLEMAQILLYPLVSLSTVCVVSMHMFSQLLVSVHYSEDFDGPKLSDLWAEDVSRVHMLIC